MWPPGQQMLSQQIVKAGKRERCAVAIAEIAQEQGLKALTTTHIVRRARIGRKTFYELFGSLDQGLEFACELAGKRLAEAVEEAVEDQPTWEERVDRAIGAFLIAVREQALLAELHLVHRTCMLGGPRGDASATALASALKQGRAEHEPELLAPPEIEELIVGGILAVVATRLRHAEAESVTELHRELVSLALMLIPSRTAAENTEDLPA